MNEKNINFIKGAYENKVSLIEAKNLFAQCLQIENLNFLIGAGCSSYWDGDTEKAIPIMGTLTSEFYSDYYKRSKKEFELNNNINAKDKYPSNLENVMNHLISFRNICEDEEIQETNEKITEINKYIFKRIYEGTKYKNVEDIYSNFYLRILNKNRRTPINIYTTNYDLYNENAMDSLKYVYNNGFSGGSKRVFNPNTYNYVMVENLNLSRDVWHSISNFINLYKIHGSISWVKENNTIVEKDLELIKNNSEYNSLMIYPTPEKDRSTLMTPYSDLFRIMQNNLLKKNSILIVIGYSFGDEHLNRIILNALSVYDFRLVIFGSGENIEKLKKVGDSRIWIINSSVTDYKVHYFNNFVNDILPLIDDEQKEIQELNENIKKLTQIFKGDGNE